MRSPTQDTRPTLAGSSAMPDSAWPVMASWSAALAVPWLVSPQGAPSPAVIPWMATLASLAFVLLTYGMVHSWGEPLDRIFVSSWQTSLVVGALVNALCGLLQLVASQYEAVAQAVGGDAQVMGLLRQRNQLATLLVLALCVLLWWRPAKNAHRFATGIALALVGTVLAATASRTGILALVFVMSLFSHYRLKGRLKLLFRSIPAMTVCTAYALTTLVLYWDGGRHLAGSGLLTRATAGGPACVGRMRIWSNVAELIGQRPWTGWGWGELAYAHVMADYRGARSCEIVDNAHDLPLHLAVTLGIPLALLLMAGATLFIWRAAPWKESDPNRQFSWAVLSVLGLHSLLEYPLWYGPFMLTACIAVWQLGQSRRTQPHDARAAEDGRSQDRPGEIRWRVAGGLTGALLLAATLYAAWDYHRIVQLYLAPAERSPLYAADPMAAARASLLFRDQVAFAAVQVTPLTPATAQQIHDEALRVLHYSPEPAVLRKLAASSDMLGHAQEAQAWRDRLHEAYPQEAP